MDEGEGDLTMTRNLNRFSKPLPQNAKRVLLATAALVVVGHAAALAQGQTAGPSAPLKFRNDYFGYGLALGPRVTYTDNIALAPSGFRDSEFAAGVATNGSAIYSTSRFTGIIDGSLDLSYLTNQGKLVASQDVGGAGTFTVSDNLFYVDIGASSARQLAGENARFSNNVNAGRNQRVNVNNFVVSPYLNRRFANGSAVELRYRYGQAFIDSNRTNLNQQIFNRNSRSQEVIATYSSGSTFNRLNMDLTAFGIKSKDYGAQLLQNFDYQQGSLQGDFQFALTNKFALAGTIGYDDVDTNAPNSFIAQDRLTGVFWNAGFSAQPGRRTDILLKYGRRYDGDFITGNIRYDLTDRISFSAQAGRTFQSRANTVSSQYQALQRQTLDFADMLRAGGSGSGESIVDALTRVSRQRVGSQQVGLGISNDVSAVLGANLGRTTIGLHGNYRDTDYGFRTIKVIGAGLSGRRDISRRMSAYTNIFYRNVDSSGDPTTCIADPASFYFDTTVPGFDPVAACNSLFGFQGKTDTITGRIGLSYRVYSNVSAFGEYSHTERFSQVPLQEYGENTLTAGLQLEF